MIVFENIIVLGKKKSGKSSIIFEICGKAGKKVTHIFRYGDYSFEITFQTLSKIQKPDESLINKATGLIYVADFNDENSISFLSKEKKIIDKINKNIPSILVVNKCDLNQNQRKLDSNEISSFTFQNSLRLVVCSSKVFFFI
jgi:ribosome biogenesis GTPase A